MGPVTHAFGRRRVGAGAAAFLAAAAVLAGPQPAEAQVGCTKVMGAATNTPGQMAGWFAATGRPAKLDVSLLDLATMFVEEGAREGVRGDIAFAQSIVETGYFGFSPSVPPATHNYSGLGATGGGVKGAGFPDARTGVRAQVQHLRAYADPSLRSAADLKAPLVDPRFGFLVPNSRTVPCWEQFGSGVWAADPTGYGPRVLGVHQRIAAFPRPAAPPAAPPVLQPAVAAVPVAEALVPAPLVAEVPVAEVMTAPALSLDAGPSGAVLAARPAVVASAARGGGVARTLGTALSGLGLLTICTTLWWHGRRFARVG